MDNINKKAYELFSSTFRQRAKDKLKSSGRGIFTGKLIDSLDIEIVGEGDDITLNIYGETYLEYIDQGVNGVGFQQTKSNRPDKRFSSNKSIVTGAPYSFKDKKPPIKAIKPWADAKGLNPYAVQNSIYKKGIQGIHFFENTIDEEYSKLADYIAEAMADELLNGFE